MRATDIVRMTLDLIDMVDKPEPKIEIQVATNIAVFIVILKIFINFKYYIS